MDGIHDLGGRHGFGKVDTDDDQVGFRERWHASVFAAVNSLFGAGIINNTDHFRHAVERINPASYLSDGYYGRWLGGIENLLLEAKVLDAATIASRLASLGGDPQAPIAAQPLDAPPVFAQHPGADDAGTSSARRTLETAPRFKVGDQVVTNRLSKAGHTRLPGYARGHGGRVVAHHGAWVYPDASAHGDNRQAQHLYTVVFDGRELYGPEAEAGVEVCIDLFEAYLTERVDE